MADSKVKRIAIVGLGNRSFKHGIPHILKSAGFFTIVAACDTEPAARERFQQQFPGVHCFEHTQELTAFQENITQRNIDCAYVAVPHAQYEGIVRFLVDAHIHILKEKPAAISDDEFRRCHEYATGRGIRILTASQGRYSERLSRLHEWLPFIGKPRFMEGTRTISCDDLGAGWRASKAISGGGALCDIGWHLIDTIFTLFKGTEILKVSYSELITTRQHQNYDNEDTAFVALALLNTESKDSGETIPCNLKISRGAIAR